MPQDMKVRLPTDHSKQWVKVDSMFPISSKLQKRTRLMYEVSETHNLIQRSRYVEHRLQSIYAATAVAALLQMVQSRDDCGKHQIIDCTVTFI